MEPKRAPQTVMPPSIRSLTGSTPLLRANADFVWVERKWGRAYARLCDQEFISMNLYGQSACHEWVGIKEY